MPRRSLIAVLAVVFCLPAATVAWLGVRLLEQDRDLEQQRRLEHRDQAAARAVPFLTTLLASLPPTPLLFRDALPDPPAEAPDPIEALERQPATLPQAIAAYQNRPSTAATLYRLGRALAKAGRPGDALDAYTRLARLDSAFAAGWPAPIAALWARCTLLESRHDKPQLEASALRLRELLLSGRYPLSRPAYTAFADDAARWTRLPRPLAAERRTAAILQLAANPNRTPTGLTVVDIENEPVTVIWTPLSTAALTAADLAAALPPSVWLRTPAGHLIGIERPGPAGIRHPADSRLPWTIYALPPDDPGDFPSRRRLLLALLAAVACSTLAAAAVAIRLIRKELALARLQQDFVAAVSHEFRTPLTTIRQLTESLEDGRLPSEERRQSAYRSLARAANRLHRLVEDLLDFRRMQSGASEYRRLPIDTHDFTLQLAADFQHEFEPRGFRIHVDPGPSRTVLADPAALNRALWNLLDNAVKYSGHSRDIHLSAAPSPGAIQWTVRDHGIGIPPAERPHIFEKFYRGQAARHAGIRGTGIGLAMVEQIVTFHGGNLAIHSEVGAGSAFTLSLPTEPNPCIES